MEDHSESRSLLVDWFASYVSTDSGQRTPESFGLLKFSTLFMGCSISLANHHEPWLIHFTALINYGSLIEYWQGPGNLSC